MNPENKNPPSDTARWLGGWRMLCLFFLFPSVVYAGFITEFVFLDPEPSAFWQVYNQYFLSLLDGRLDIPYWAIGKEGLYVGDKVYAYFGIAPLITRALAYPFVDLEMVSLSRFSIWLFLVAGNSVVQWSLIGFFVRKSITDASGRPFKQLILFSLIIWFGSAATIIIQSSALYHEPFAASLFFLSVFAAVFANDVLWAEGPRRYRLMVYAVLAALCIHARVPTAVGMLLATAALIVVATFEAVATSEANHRRGGEFWTRYLRTFVRNGVGPGIIVGASFGLMFWMNDARFGSWYKLVDFTNHGFFLDGEGFSIRICTFLNHGYFNIERLVPNALYYLFGNLVPHGTMIDALGLTFVRLEGPSAFLALGWFVPLVLFGFFWWHSWRGPMWGGKIVTVTVVLALCVGNLAMLTFGTITYRYAADLWAPLLLTLLWGARYMSEAGAKAPEKMAVFVIRASVVVFLSFEFFAATYYLGYHGIALEKNYSQIMKHPASTDPTSQGDVRQCEKYH